MKIRPVGAELLHAERQTDRPTDRETDTGNEANSVFMQFFERTQKRSYITSDIYHIFIAEMPSDELQTDHFMQCAHAWLWQKKKGTEEMYSVTLSTVCQSVHAHKYSNVHKESCQACDIQSYIYASQTYLFGTEC